MQLPVAHPGILHQEGLEASWAGKTWEAMELEIKHEVLHDLKSLILERENREIPISIINLWELINMISRGKVGFINEWIMNTKSNNHMEVSEI